MLMIKVLFFGKLSDDVGLRELSIETPANISVNTIITLIAQKHGSEFATALQAEDVIAAVNKTVQGDRDALNEGVSELAFFPPVTGG